MRKHSFAALLSFVLCIRCAAGSELEGNSFDDESQAPLLSVKITITYVGDKEAFSEQDTNKMGRYVIKDLKKGTMVVRADHADYAFSTEKLLLEDMQKKTIDFPGMKRPKNQNYLVLIAKCITNAALFDEESAGAEAQWNTLLRYNFNSDELQLLASEYVKQSPAAKQNRNISEFAGADPQNLKAAQKQFEMYLAHGEHRFGEMDVPPSAIAVIGSRAVTEYLSRHGGSDEATDRLKALYGAMSESLKPETAIAVSKGVESERMIRQLRNQDWNASFDKLDKWTDCSLKLRGDVGELRAENEDARASLKRVYYVPTKDGISIQARVDGHSPLWVTVSVAKGTEDKFTGDWGRGSKIGEGNTVGLVRGEAMK